MSQVTIRYEDEVPVAVESVVLSCQHADDVSSAVVKDVISKGIITPVLGELPRSKTYSEYINPTGRFVTGGPHGDTGLTGRKIIVDTYGGRCPHGGGAFSGKDPTKVDRSAAYAARWVAKHIIAAGVARRCTVQIAYAIGIDKPTSLMVDTHGTGIAPDWVIEWSVGRVFDLTPGGIIRDLDLRRPIYGPTAAYGHFGRDRAEFTWEQLGRVRKLKSVVEVVDATVKEKDLTQQNTR